MSSEELHLLPKMAHSNEKLIPLSQQRLADASKFKMGNFGRNGKIFEQKKMLKPITAARDYESHALTTEPSRHDFIKEDDEEVLDAL